MQNEIPVTQVHDETTVHITRDQAIAVLTESLQNDADFLQQWHDLLTVAFENGYYAQCGGAGGGPLTIKNIGKSAAAFFISHAFGATYAKNKFNTGN